jgi:hypothetical protein
MFDDLAEQKMEFTAISPLVHLGQVNVLEYGDLAQL